ncbi:multicomponent Na+:H+ antiporter subunit E [Tangfeifania diversioriginum]|jgi:multisubunit Na+/H+ antiporter MnhE subunit|uniref:Multicomponent Na+:H+ antiporter subunit E n=1 Tax=Tangfeifania diversioriginum TaxID=1168035 RepID=A0A1M6INZ3_9BACT|nr:Na+/H+ antiporter subunit E [Tangfeifania diversioriginum]SHJ36152.1 multicomponent Na+:H+ antiporter subunit E [Tangfeifania diversioriginum]
MKLLKKIYFTLEFIVFYLVKLVEANFYIAWDILTPKMHTKPAFMEIPVTLKSDLGLLLFSNLLSMTPGTMSMDISPDKKTVLVHVLYYSTDDIMLKDFNRIQDKIKRVTG